jgi:subtilisin-like proprotein convertase family protein
MNTLRRYLFTDSATGIDSHGHGMRPPCAWAITQTLTAGLLVATLALTAVLPAIAGDGPHKRHRNAQRQEQGPSAEAGGKGNKNGKAKNVKKNFANDGEIEILGEGAANPYPSTIQVNGFKKARIRDVNVTLRAFSHEFTQDVNVLLVAPGGRNAVVMGDVGSVTDPDQDALNLTLTLDDEAAESLPVVDEMKNGTFRPLDSVKDTVFPNPAPAPSGNITLSTFDGIDPNGEWQLFIVDDIAGDAGSLAEGWTLEITAKAKSKNKHKKKR